MGLRIIIILIFLSGFGFGQDGIIYTLTDEDMKFVLKEYVNDASYFYQCGTDSTAKWDAEKEMLYKKIMGELEKGSMIEAINKLISSVKLTTAKDDTSKYYIALGRLEGWLSAMTTFEELVIKKYNDRLRRLSIQNR